MKLLFCLVPLLGVSAFGQAPSDAVIGAPVLQTITFSPVIANGTVTAVNCQAIFSTTISSASTGFSSSADFPRVPFDLIVKGATTVTAGGMTVTYAQLSSLIQAMAAQESATALAAAIQAKQSAQSQQAQLPP